MKQNILFTAVIAISFTACTSTDSFREINTPQENGSIKFAAYSEKATKANDESNSNHLYDFYKAFSVYGFKTVNGTASPVFSNDPVEHFSDDVKGTYVYNGDGEKPSDEWGTDWANNSLHSWFYEDVRFWDKLATAYSFFAIAPYAATHSPALTVADNLSNIQIGKPAQGEQAADLYDITTEKNLANPLTQDRKYFGFYKDYLLADKNTTKGSLVDFDFHHILTKFNVKISLQQSFIGRQVVKVDLIEIVGFENNGYFVYNTSMTTNGWQTSGTTYSLSNPTDYALANYDKDQNSSFTQNYSGYYWFQNLIFPQTLTCTATGAKSALADVSGDKYLHIIYYIGNEKYEAYYNLAYIFNPQLLPAEGQTPAGTYELAQGSEYTIDIKVGPEPIIFDAEVNSAWTVVNAAEPEV